MFNFLTSWFIPSQGNENLKALLKYQDARHPWQENCLRVYNVEGKNRIFHYITYGMKPKEPGIAISSCGEYYYIIRQGENIGVVIPRCEFNKHLNKLIDEAE